MGPSSRHDTPPRYAARDRDADGAVQASAAAPPGAPGRPAADDGIPAVSSVRIVVASLLVVAGGLALLRATGVVTSDLVAGWWSIAVAALGLLQLTFGDNRYARTIGLALVLVGGAFTVARWNPELVQPESVWKLLWPAAILTLGGYLLLRTLGPRERSAQGERESIFAFWAGVERSVDSQEFAGGDLSAIMGGFELDLRGATLPESGEAVVEVLAVMGGGVVYVPKGWVVDSRVAPIMGGVSIKTTSKGDAEGRLCVRGLALMGGIEIRN
ncbi:MAG: hypothetical protein AAGB93_11755 [Planctomycetota bacterium]